MNGIREGFLNPSLLDQESAGNLEPIQPPCAQLAEMNLTEAPLDQMIRQFMKIHQECLTQQLRRFHQKWTLLASEEKAHKSDLNWIRDLLEELVCELDLHVQKEEMILFPKVLRIARSEKKDFFRTESELESLGLIHDTFSSEHERLKSIARETSAIAYNLRNRPDLDARMTMECACLEEFLLTLESIIHLEENILIPAVKQAVGIQSKTE